MSEEQHPNPKWLASVFRFIVAKRWWVVAVCAIVLGPSVFYALKVPQDNSIDRLIVQTDPDYIAAHDFEKVFGAAEYVILLAEADDPFATPVLSRLSAMEEELGKVPKVEVNSALSVYRRAKAGFSATPEQTADFKKFVTGTDVFSRQHLYGEHFLAIPLVLTIKGTDDRAATLDRVNAITAQLEKDPAPLSRLRKVGQPYVNDYLDKDTRATGIRYFPLFFLFVTGLCVALYRSWRTLLAVIITLAMQRRNDGGLRRHYRRRVYHRFVARADDHPHHLHRDAGLPAVALHRAPARGPRRRAPDLRPV